MPLKLRFLAAVWFPSKVVGIPLIALLYWRTSTPHRDGIRGPDRSNVACSPLLHSIRFFQLPGKWDERRTINDDPQFPGADLSVAATSQRFRWCNPEGAKLGCQKLQSTAGLYAFRIPANPKILIPFPIPGPTER
jgi:hypothetical protein